MKLKKINANKYIVENAAALEHEVMNIVKSISDNKFEMFEESVNFTLIDTIASRVVAEKFFEQHKEKLSTLNFLTIDLKIGSRNITCSIGKAVLSSEETKYLNGVLHR